MIALQTSDLNKNIDVFIRKAIEGENVLLTNELNEAVIIISPKEYADYQKLKHNFEYIEMLDRGYEDIRLGKGVHKTMDELETMANE